MFGNTGSIFTGRKQLGNRGHDTVRHGDSRHFIGGFRVYQTQPHAHRKGRRKGSFLRTTVRHTAVLFDHVRPRTQTHGLCLCHTKVSCEFKKE